jgi:hypothetical protein
MAMQGQCHHLVIVLLVQKTAYIAGISARVITSAMAVIPSRDALKFIASNYLIMVKRIFPD